jgi:hypothetical protein
VLLLQKVLQLALAPGATQETEEIVCKLVKRHSVTQEVGGTDEQLELLKV